MNDLSFDLGRFVAAQEGVYPRALVELRAGRKASHWMWFIFPQLDGLGSSPMARRYAIRLAAEARAYLAHKLLGERLRECTRAVNAHPGIPAPEIFGPVDAQKLRSSMTLFDAVADGEEPFAVCLQSFFNGDRDQATLALLR